jgi:hypothetical protein
MAWHLIEKRMTLSLLTKVILMSGLPESDGVDAIDVTRRKSTSIASRKIMGHASFLQQIDSIISSVVDGIKTLVMTRGQQGTTIRT